MIRFTLIFIGTVSVLNVVSAINENATIEEIYDIASNILNATEQWQQELKNSSIEGRKSKFFPFAGLLPFHALCECIIIQFFNEKNWKNYFNWMKFENWMKMFWKSRSKGKQLIFFEDILSNFNNILLHFFQSLHLKKNSQNDYV